MVKRYRKKDPFASRESMHYENPIPSREFILQYLKEVKRPVTLKHLHDAFGIKAEDALVGLQRRLDAMIRDGQLMANRRGSYGLVTQMDLVAGRIQGHREGFGALIRDDGKADIFLAPREMRALFPGDRVLVRPNIGSRRRRMEGSVVEILERNMTEIVGRYFEDGGLSFVEPNHRNLTQDILIEREGRGDAKPGDYVSVAIEHFPTRRRQAVGRITAIFGDHLTPGLEVDLAMRSYDIPFEWPAAVDKQIAKLPTAISSSEIKHREDFRDFPFVTIDGSDARDFDDAVYCEKTESGDWRLMVAIADVSSYVKPGSALDQEANARGNSVYFPSRVIPMLPEVLSNGLCSLKPNEDRLVMLCDMVIDNDGECIEYSFSEAVIHSHARLTYTEVASKLTQKKPIDKGSSAGYWGSVTNLYHLHKLLLQARRRQGTIEFETVETRIVFNEGGRIDRIEPYERNVAHRLIEEAMLIANVCAAECLEEAKLPFLYRIHAGPDESKLMALKKFLKPFGLRLSGGDEPHATDYARLLERIHKRKDASLLQTVLLRSLRQAVYATENLGHFGLAFPAYAHFTSPIRRYPDLLVHRALKHVLSQKAVKKFCYKKEDMDTIAEHCSVTERRADRATREATDWLKCHYMKDKLGEEYTGKIVDVTSFGVFIELDNVYVQGLVHITSLTNDYYQYDNANHLLRGKRSNQVYRLGDRLRVRLARVDLDARSIDFELLK